MTHLSVRSSPLPRARATLRDVALAAGVSKTVASRALAGYADVAPATRERILRMAGDLGYRASARAQALSAGKGALARCAVVSLGMTSAEFGRSFYGPVLTGIAAQASSQGMDVHLVTIPSDSADLADALGKLVAEDRADGFILLTFIPLAPNHVRPLDAAGTPYVLINRHFDEQPINCVTPDWAAAMEEAVEYLVALGHRRLAALLEDTSTSAVRDRARGWREGAARHAIATEDAPILYFGGGGWNGGYDLTNRLLTAGPAVRGVRPTGLVCFDDYCAHGVLAAARDLGVAVPEELSVLSFDDVIAAYTMPPLCSFDPHLHELGVAAATLLAAVLHGDQPEPRRVLVKPNLRRRESCGPAPESMSRDG